MRSPLDSFSIYRKIRLSLSRELYIALASITAGPDRFDSGSKMLVGSDAYCVSAGRKTETSMARSRFASFQSGDPTAGTLKNIAVCLVRSSRAK